VAIRDGASGKNIINAAGDTKASTGKTLIYSAGSGSDTFTGGFENDVVKVSAAAVGGDTLTGGSETDALTLTTAGTVNFSGVSKFGTINLAAGNNTVTVADTTLSGGSVTIKAGTSGNNSVTAAGDTVASFGKTLTYVAAAGTDSFSGGFEVDVVQVSAAAVGRDILTGGLYGSNKLTLTTAGTLYLSGVSRFGTINLAAGDNTVTVFDTTLRDGSVTIKDGAFKDGTGGDNSISAAGDTVESIAKTLTYVAGTGTDNFTGGWEIDVVKVGAEAVSGDTLTGGIFNAATLDLTTADTFSLSGVGKFATINLAAGNNTVAVTDKTLSGGPVAIRDGASGNNIISAAGDTKASTGKTLTYAAGAGADTLTGGFENDVVKVSAAAVTGDTLTGGSGTNTLDLTTAGKVSLSGVSKFATINLAAGNNTVAVTDKTLNGGSVTIKDGAGGNNIISVAGDTKASAGKTLTYVAGAGTEKFTGGFENDIVHAGADADVLTGGAGNDVLYAGGDTTMTGAGGANEFVFSAAGNNTITDFAASAVTPTLTTLVSFTGANGAEPYGGLIADAAGTSSARHWSAGRTRMAPCSRSRSSAAATPARRPPWSASPAPSRTPTGQALGV
jgi:Ca2+-binding RTX toxin-like protein